MTDEPNLPPYLLAQRYEVEPIPSHLCICVSDVLGAPVGAYVARSGCDLCSGLGVIFEPDRIAEAEALGFEPIPPGHPALEQESYIPGMGGSGPRR